MESFVSLAYAVIGAAVGLGILIVVHELGHFLVAKKTGVGVLTFSIGFGPKLAGRKIGETEYVLSAFPLGGYVKMVGEDPEEAVGEADIQKSFSHQGLLKRTAIVAAGPIFNLLLAVLVFVWVFVFYGVVVSTTRVAAVESGSPAARAGIKKGDRIVEIDGEAVTTWSGLSRRVKGSGGKPLRIGIERNGAKLSLSVQPVRREARNVFGEKQDVWAIGVASEAAIEKRKPLLALGEAFYRTGEYAALTLVALYKILKGDLSPKNLGGPVLIAKVAGEQAREGAGNFFLFIAVLSVNLGVLNLLPVPVLDGGHLAFFLLEWIIGRPVTVKVRERAQQVGIFILILVMIYAFYNDIARFFEG